MFIFPDNLYTDVRIENVFETKILFTLGNLDECKSRSYKAAFIRIFDGKRWYYSSTSEIENIQREINNLASYAEPRIDILENPIVKRLQINKEEKVRFGENNVSLISLNEKADLLKGYFPILESSELIKLWRTIYVDKRNEKYFYSSKGAEVKFDTQIIGMSLGFSMSYEDKNFSDGYQFSHNSFDALKGKDEKLKEYIEECEDFTKNSKSIPAGKYTVVLSPLAAGVFAHESFGHKSEADFMIGDETMKKEWVIGKKVGTEILSIIDDGNKDGSGYIPFDDEGTKAEETYLVKNGVLQGRLHSSATASSLEEVVTGNARALNFEFEPIVRMTTTYIVPGKKTKEELFSEIENGIYVENIKHGSGMSTFTIAPNRCYLIKDGKVSEPVSVSVISGNVMATLGEIDGVSDELELLSFVLGGCGKNEQYNLPVGFGGPYVRVRNMNVQ